MTELLRIASSHSLLKPGRPGFGRVWNVHCPATASKTRPIPSSDIAVSQAVTDVSYDVQFFIKGAHDRGDRRNFSGPAGSPPKRRRGLPRTMPPLFLRRVRAPADARLACPANSGYPSRSGSLLGVRRHRGDLPLVERAGLDQSKQPRPAIETEFVERVARGHGIKMPLPFEHDLHGGQRTVFFD